VATISLVFLRLFLNPSTHDVDKVFSFCIKAIQTVGGLVVRVVNLRRNSGAVSIGDIIPERAVPFGATPIAFQLSDFLYTACRS
jgi:hypothetical protein